MTDDAIPAGMKPWAGGDAAPADWDGGGRVQFRNGNTIERFEADAIPTWKHTGWGGDIIAYTPTPSIVSGSDERAREVDIHETMRLVEYDMTNRRRDGDGFVGERKEVAAIITALRAALAASRPTDAGAVRDGVARALYLRRNPVEHVENTDFMWKCAKGHSPEYLADYYADADAVIAALATPKSPVDEGVMRERCAKVSDDAAEGASVLHNAAAKDRDRDGTLVHGEAWRVAKQIAASIRNLTGDGAGA